MPAFYLSPSEILLLVEGLYSLPSSPLSISLQEKLCSAVDNDATVEDGTVENGGTMENGDTDIGMVQDVETGQEVQEESVNPPNQSEVNPGGTRSTRRPRWTGVPCHRNGLALAAQPQPEWKVNEENTESSNVTAQSLLACLATASFSDLSHTLNPHSWIRSIKDTATLSEISDKLGNQDLVSIVQTCSIYRSKEVGMSFLVMLSFIQLAFTCQRMCNEETPPLRLSTIYVNHLASLQSSPAQRTFIEWVSFGKKFARLAAGGTIYVLVIVAGLDRRWDVARASYTVISSLGQMLREPKKAKKIHQKLILDAIIPTLAQIRREMPLQFKVEGYEQLNCADLKTSDRMFDGLKMKSLTLQKRSVGTWATFKDAIDSPAADPLILPCSPLGNLSHTTLLPTPSDTPAPASPHFGSLGSAMSPDLQFPVTALITGYDPNSPANTPNPCSQDRDENAMWTSLQRQAAGNGIMAQDGAHLRQLLSTLYDQGAKKDANSYIRIPMTLFEGGLDLRNSDGNLMAFICNAMPSRLRGTLEAKLSACLGDDDTIFNWRDSRDRAPFSGLHFSWYNRYTTDGKGAPDDVHPFQLQRENTTRANTSQYLPYMSKDFEDHKQLFDDLTASFKDVFNWIEDVLQMNLPAEYQVLVEFVESLPGQPGSPVSPFVSFVLNINVCTQGHRDVGDKHLCLVMAIGDFEGGALVLREPGLVIELLNGDFAAFKSDRITHFNLDYVGRRASFVLQSDRAFERWVARANGWSTNAFYV